MLLKELWLEVVLMKKKIKKDCEFSSKEQEMLQIFFDELNKKILLSKKDTKLFNNDFMKAINYYYNNGYELSEIVKLLSPKKIGNFYSKKMQKWYSLDNAAKLYPLSMKKNWMAVFRLSIYANEDIIPEILQIALTYTIERFPIFATTVRRGFFWHYIEEIRIRFGIAQENNIPVRSINISNLTRKTFRVLYYKNRISVEFFHVLTDGTGGMTFLKTLAAEYFRLLGKNIPNTNGILSLQEHPQIEEAANDFIKGTKYKSKFTNDKPAVQIDGKLSKIKPCQVIHFDFSSEEIMKYCKTKDITVTVLMLALIITACNYSTSKKGDIKVQVPVNMRKYYDSNTLRNFSLYVLICVSKDNCSDFDLLLKNIKEQLNTKTTKEALSKNMSWANNTVAKTSFIPLFIKKTLVGLGNKYLGNMAFTTVLSNLGNIDMPNELRDEIDKMDFVLGTTLINRVLFSLVTCNNTMTLSISKFTLNSALENNLYNMISSLGFKVTVSGSDVYEN